MNIPLAKKGLMAILPPYRTREVMIPSGTLEITENGLYDVFTYAKANVDCADALFGKRYRYGSFTVDEDTKGSAIEIAHGLDVIPGFFLVWCSDFAVVGRLNYTELGCFYVKDSFQGKILRWALSNGTTMLAGSSNTATANVTSEKVILPETAGAAYYRPGYTYRWLAIE